jgi:hypothetical protein
VLRVEARVEGPAGGVDRGARGPEALPQLLADRLGQARAVVLVLLPGRERGVDLSRDGLPLRAAIVSTPTTMAVRSATAASTAAFCSSRCCSVSSLTVPPSASRRACSAARSPTALAPLTSAASFVTVRATSVALAPAFARCSTSAICPARSANLRSK